MSTEKTYAFSIDTDCGPLKCSITADNMGLGEADDTIEFTLFPTAQQQLKTHVGSAYHIATALFPELMDAQFTLMEKKDAPYTFLTNNPQVNAYPQGLEAEWEKLVETLEARLRTLQPITLAPLPENIAALLNPPAGDTIRNWSGDTLQDFSTRNTGHSR